MDFVTQILEWRKSTSNVFCEIVVLVVNRLQELHRHRRRGALSAHAQWTRQFKGQASQDRGHHAVEFRHLDRLLKNHAGDNPARELEVAFFG